MKDSGIEWIGKVPEDWEVKKMKYYGVLDSSGVDKKIREDENTYKSVHYMDVYRGSLTEIGNKDSYLIISTTSDKAERCLLKKGDVLFTNSSETPEDMGHSTVIKEDLENTLFGYHLMRFRPIIEFNLQFEKYLFASTYMRNWFSYCSIGMTRYGINSSSFSNALLIVPSIEEQQKIADYLDGKVTQIDNIITQTTLSIQEYKKYKQSLITETVTKGLNSDVQMKDSGIEWIGQIPKDWNIKRLRYLGTLQNGISKSSDYFGSGFPFVSYGDVYKNIQLPLNGSGLINSNDIERENYSVRQGDVLFTRTSETIEEVGFAATCLKTIEKAVFAGFVIRFRPFTNELNENYSKYYFRSEMHRRFFVKEMNLVTRASLSQELLKKLPVIIPSKAEQQEIADYLDKKCSKIDTLITEKEQLTTELQAYKKSLIYECVTGKREVK